MKTALPALFIFALTLLLALALPAPNALARGGGHGGGGGFHNDGGGPWGGAMTQPHNGTDVSKGQLSPAEIERLKSQEESAQKLADTLDGAAALTKDELKATSDLVESASAAIWSKGSDDDDGKILTRYGDKYFLVDQLAKLLKSGPITRPQARELLTYFKSIMATRVSLSEDDLTADQRTTFQKKLNDMLGKYFTAK